MRYRITAFVVGACAFHLVPTMPTPGVLAAVAALALVMLRILPGVACVLVGALLSAFTANTVLADRWPTDRHGEDILVTGEVISLPEHAQLGGRFLFAPDRGLHPGLPARIRVAWFLEEALPEAGTRWRLALRMRSPIGSLNPRSFDYEGWLAARRIGATATVRPLPRPLRLEAGRGRPLLKVRAVLDDALTSALGSHPRRAIIRGLALGERGEVDAAAWEVFARTGTAHLMAISGLHVGMVATLVYLVVGGALRLLPAPPGRIREVAVIGGVIAAGVYAALSGFAVPARRAFSMLLVAAACLCLRRQGVGFTGWLIALAWVVGSDPLAPLHIGFWLSFAAVGVIGWVFLRRRGHAGGLGGLLRAQWAVTIGLAPLTVWFFQRGSVVAPLVNLVAIPVFTLAIVPAVLVGTALAVVAPTVASVWLGMTAECIEAVWHALEWAGGWQGALVFAPKPPWAWMTCALAGAVLLLAPRGLPLRWCLGVSLFIPMVAWQPAPPAEGQWRITVLDVGQGLAVVVRTARHTLLYDAGPSFGAQADAGSRIVVPYLRAEGIRAVDLIIISHPHRDHDGGLAAVRAAYPSAQVRAGDPQAAGVGAAPCLRGQQWTWDGVRFRILHPRGGGAHDPNLVSCVLELGTEHASALLPGDIEWPTELQLAATGGGLAPVDVLVVAHHGSGTSSIPRFLQRVSPDWALIPAGFGNRWGFPDAAVVARLREAGADIRIVGASGALTIEVDRQGNVLPPTEERLRQRRWWRTLLSSAERGNG